MSIPACVCVCGALWFFFASVWHLYVSQGKIWRNKEEVRANWILTLSDGGSFIASKNACSAHPTASLPGNAAYGHLIEFPKRSLYGLSNHHLMYNCLCVSTPPSFFFFTKQAVIPIWTAVLWKWQLYNLVEHLDIIYLFMSLAFIHIRCKAFAKAIKFSVFGSMGVWHR